MSSQQSGARLIPTWAWSVSLLVVAVLMGLAAQVVTLTSWEGDKASLEEHRALFFASALARVVSEQGEYQGQRFARALAADPGAGVAEAFVIADGGEDEFGISRGQSYTVQVEEGLRGKVLSELEGERHRVRAERFSRATSGLAQSRQEGRAAPWFVLERDDGGLVQAAQVPALGGAGEGGPRVHGAAGVSVRGSVPAAPLPWALTLGLVLGGWLAGTGALWALRGRLRTNAARGAAVCGLALALALGSWAALWSHYEGALRPWAQERVEDLGRVEAAAEHAQVRGEAQARLLRGADVTFSASEGYLLPAGEVARGELAEVLLANRYGSMRWVLGASLLGLWLVLVLGHRLLAQVVLTCRTEPHAYLYVAPSLAGMLLLVFIPFATGIGLSVFDNDARRYYYVGLSNFVEIVAGKEGGQVSFYRTLGVTALWTVMNVALHVGIGLGLALLLKDPALRFKKVYRVLLIVPWAIPNYITALIWKGMFNKEFGAVNQLIGSVQAMLGQTPEGVDWLGGSFATAFTANLVTNTWLGFPFMMVVSLGALQSIPGELYEAADVDGATAWQKFRHITAPLLKPALFPAIILGTIWTFNMFNVIYLVSGGGPNNSTEILITDAYRAFAVLNRHGLAAAYSVIIFLILFVYTVMTNRITKATDGAFE